MLGSGGCKAAAAAKPVEMQPMVIEEPFDSSLAHLVTTTLRLNHSNDI
jgi:hypothetical protein